MEEILQDWENFAPSLPSSKGPHVSALRQHAQEILHGIADHMSLAPLPQNEERQAQRQIANPTLSLNLASKHVEARHGEGFDLHQVAAEYRALRSSVLRSWTRRKQAADLQTLQEMIRFHEEIDQALSHAIAKFEYLVAEEGKQAEAARRESEQRQQFLLALSDALRAQPDEGSIKAEAVQRLAEYLGLERCWISEVHEEQGVSMVDMEHVRKNLAALSPVFTLADYPEAMRQLATQPMVVQDVATDARFLPGEKDLLAELQLRALLVVPLRKEQNGVIWTLAGAMSSARQWTDGERLLMEEVAERTWSAAARARAETSLRQREEVLAREIEAMQHLQQLSVRSIEAGQPEQLHELVLDTALALVNADMGSLQGHNPEPGGAGKLLLLAHRGLGEEGARYWEWVGHDSRSACGKALLDGRRVEIEDIDSSELMAGSEDLRVSQAIGIRAVQTTPLLSRSGELLGAFSTHWKRPYRLSDAERRMLDVLARQAADLLERQRTEATVRASEQRLEQIIEQLPVSVGLFGLDGKLLISNSRMRATIPASIPAFDEQRRARWVGYHASGRPALPEEWPGVRALRGERVSPGMDFCYTPADGGPETWFLISTAPFRDASDKVTGAVAVMQDMTELRRAEQALRRSEERLRLALSAANMGTWTWQVTSDRHRRDANLNRLLGLAAVETVLPIEEFFSHIHEDDRARVREAFEASVRQGHNLRRDFRVIWPNGELRWLSDQGDVFGAGDERYLAGACLDITERKRLEEELQEADRRKNDFLATLAHELRNPLAPIRTGIEVLRAAGDSSGATADAIAMMDRQMCHLIRLVDDLLDISRVSRGKITLRRETVDVRDAITRALETTRAFTHAGDRQVFVDYPARPLKVNADPVRLVQIIGNLLSNAGKYTSEQGRIWISANERDEVVRISIRDDGLGLAPEAQRQLFQMFMQVDTQRSGGLGVGLALVRNLVELHDGSIEAHSAGLGKGSEFIVRLPLAEESETLQDVVAREHARPLAGQRVLVVDDNQDAANALATLLSLMKADVRTAYEGRAALALFESFHPHLVLLDLGMPELDGYEVARRLRHLPFGKKVRLVALTGWGQAEDLRRTQQAGFDAHLVKPIELKDLERVFRTAKSGDRES